MVTGIYRSSSVILTKNDTFLFLKMRGHNALKCWRIKNALLKKIAKVANIVRDQMRTGAKLNVLN